MCFFVLFNRFKWYMNLWGHRSNLVLLWKWSYATPGVILLPERSTIWKICLSVWCKKSIWTMYPFCVHPIKSRKLWYNFYSPLTRYQRRRVWKHWSSNTDVLKRTTRTTNLQCSCMLSILRKLSMDRICLFFLRKSIRKWRRGRSRLSWSKLV